MSTLVYFASGPPRDEYKDLNFDKIYLIDNFFKDRYSKSINEFLQGKIICIGMDCFKSISFLKNERVQIDCFVSLNEGLYEGGGVYAINSDMFLGYCMPLFKEKYVHIMNKKYYFNSYNVSMDLPYSIEEITEDDISYLSPFIFSKEDYHKKNAKVFQMSKYEIKHLEIKINPRFKLKILHDSIWNYHKEIDACVISFSRQGQGNFFDTIPKVINFSKTTLNEIFDFCEKNKIAKIGFTPFGRGRYTNFLQMLEKLKNEYPKEIVMFHLNKNDYKEIKEYGEISD